jgi:hypothetical protein
VTATVEATWADDGSLVMTAEPGTRAAIEDIVRDALGITTMVIDASSFLEALKRVEHAAIRAEDGPPVLRCIHVTHGRVEAADNYRVSRSSFGCEPCEGSFLFHVADVPVLVAWLSTMLKGTSVNVLIGDVISFEVGFAARLTLPRFTGTYPNTDAVLPTDDAPVQIALSAAFLGDLKKLGKGVLRVGLWGSQRGVLFTLVSDDEISEWVSPVRLIGITEWGKPADRAVDPETGELRESDE